MSRTDKLGGALVTVLLIGLATSAKSCLTKMSERRAAQEDCARQCSPSAPDLWGTSEEWVCYCDLRKVKP